MLAVGESDAFVAKTNTGKITRSHWGSDAPTVATVDADTGQVTAVGFGTATIFAELKGIRGTRVIRTVPNFSGSWAGAHEDVSCESSGDFAFIQPCGDAVSDFYMWPTAMTLTQHRDQISGKFSISWIETGDVTGSVLSDGTLLFTGKVSWSQGQFELQNVRFKSSAAGPMTGSFEKFYVKTGLSGSLRYFSKLRDITRLTHK